MGGLPGLGFKEGFRAASKGSRRDPKVGPLILKLGYNQPIFMPYRGS